MPTSLSSFLKIPSSQITSQGAFDPILDLDTRLFIDPHLLKHLDVPEFENSYTHFQKHFKSIAKLLTYSSSPKDFFWRQADRMMNWSEVRGLCIGYAAKGTSGSGIGPELRTRLLTTATLILDKGKDDPELFELVGMFENDFGADRISDMTANIIKPDLASFTQRVFLELDINIENYLTINRETNLPKNPFSNEDIYLVPQLLLRDLPVSLDWSSRDLIFRENQALRDRINSLVGLTWKQVVTSFKKKDI